MIADFTKERIIILRYADGHSCVISEKDKWAGFIASSPLCTNNIKTGRICALARNVFSEAYVRLADRITLSHSCLIAIVAETD